MKLKVVSAWGTDTEFKRLRGSGKNSLVAAAASAYEGFDILVLLCYVAGFQVYPLTESQQGGMFLPYAILRSRRWQLDQTHWPKIHKKVGSCNRSGTPEDPHL